MVSFCPLAACWTLLPSKKRCNSMERVVMGDKYRYRNDAKKLRHLQLFHASYLNEFSMRRGLLPRRLRGRCCTQSTDVPALVMRFRVQLLLKRGATTPSSINARKTTLTCSFACVHYPYLWPPPASSIQSCSFTPPCLACSPKRAAPATSFLQSFSSTTYLWLPLSFSASSAKVPIQILSFDPSMSRSSS